tara:strand:+ start:11888 stop:16099 length:4212 start_codon:yes stop_codon:yes gene_type:complete
MEKFYNENTEFLDDIILDITDIKFTDLNASNVEEKKVSVVITKLVQNEYIQYSEQDFKNSLVILFKNIDYNIKLIDNLYNIFKKIDNNIITDEFEYKDDNLKPIIFINKKFYTNEDDIEKENNRELNDFIIYNDNVNIIKLGLSEHRAQRNNIMQNPYNIVQNQLFNLDKPFEDDNNNIGLLELQNYIPSYDRDTLTSCIFENSDNFNKNNYQCVNIDNEPIKLETFRILSPKSITFDKTTINYYNGDNVKIVGYINKIPSIDEEYKIFDLDKYYEDVDNLEKGEDVNIYFNIKLDKVKIKGIVNSIKDNKINIKLYEKIKIEDISTKVLIYDKNSNDNDFYIYPQKEENIYYKNLLKDNIIAFKFSKENFEKSSLFIFPNIYQLISYYDDIVNYNNVKNILNENHYNIDNLNENDISLIHSKLEKNITDIESIPKEKLKKKIFDFKKLKPTELSLLNFKNLPNKYFKYYDFIEDTDENRFKFITLQNDLGNIHFLNKLKLQLAEDYKEIEDNDFDAELDRLKIDKINIEDQLKKFKDNDCNQIQIHKFYYGASQFEEDKDNQKYNDKYAVLIEDNISTLYFMERGNWKKIRIIDDKNEVKICDGKYYYEKIKENKCTYDDVKKLCEKRDFINLRNKLEIIKNQINFTKDLKDFKLKYQKYIDSIDNIIKKNKEIVNNEFKYEQISYKKKKIQNKYVGNEDYVDFAEQFENIDSNNLETFNPLNLTTEVHNPYKDERNFLLIEKILNNIGFELNLNEKLYIYESIDFLTTESFNKKIQALKKTKPKLSTQKLIKEFSYEKERMNLLVIAGLIIIVIQIQFPNVEFKQLYNRCSDNFSVEGYPRNKDEGEKQLYKYVLCVISDSYDFKYKLDSDEVKYKLKEPWLKNTITFILQKKDFLKRTLENKTDIDDTTPQNINQIWAGFKPELDMRNQPTSLISKYLYDIHNVVNKSKILNFNVFKKPLKSNICCLEEVNSDSNYYNLIKNRIDYNDYNTKFKSNVVNRLIINEVFFNIIKNKLYSNFDNNKIFTEEVTLKNVKSYKLDKPELNYFNFNDKFTRILNNQSNIQIKNDENLKEIIENLDKDNNWNRFSTEIDEIFKNIMTFTKNNSELLTNEIEDDLTTYFISLELDDLSYLKRILQKFINTKISSIIHQIKNYNVINKINKKYLKSDEIGKINEIKEKSRINVFIEHIQALDTFKDFNFNIILENINCSVVDINIPDNNKKNPDIDNLTKNIYILNYIFLNIILYIYSSLLYETPTLFDNKTILNEVGNIRDINVSPNFKIIADIVSFIFTEFRDTIKNNLIHKEKLQSKMDKLREERKNMKLNIFEKLDVDEADTMKLLKDIVGIEYDYEKENTNTALATEPTTEVDIQDHANQLEENENYTEYLDYQGENADEIDNI